jgi:hypothetical protein
LLTAWHIVVKNAKEIARHRTLLIYAFISAVRNAEVVNGDTEAVLQAELNLLEGSGAGSDLGEPLSLS